MYNTVHVQYSSKLLKRHRDNCAYEQGMDASSVLSSTLSSPDHVPISADWTRHYVSTLERSNYDTAPNHLTNNRVTQAMRASESEQVASVYVHIERGTSSKKTPTEQVQSTLENSSYCSLYTVPPPPQACP